MNQLKAEYYRLGNTKLSFKEWLEYIQQLYETKDTKVLLKRLRCYGSKR